MVSSLLMLIFIFINFIYIILYIYQPNILGPKWSRDDFSPAVSSIYFVHHSEARFQDVMNTGEKILSDLSKSNLICYGLLYVLSLHFLKSWRAESEVSSFFQSSFSPPSNPCLTLINLNNPLSGYVKIKLPASSDSIHDPAQYILDFSNLAKYNIL